MAAEPKTTTASDAADLLLHELWREILIRISSVKSILRCRFVCKSWYSLISCPNFISNYSIRNLNKNGNRLLLQLYDVGPEVCSYSSYVELSTECREHNDIPESFLNREVEIVGTCNGLICLSKCLSTKDIGDNVSVITFFIWNPTINKTVELPSRTYCSRTQQPSYYGFGFDSTTNDYKVLCVVAYLGEKCDEFYDEIVNVCEVFDLRKGVWRVINPEMHPSWSVGYHKPACYLNGVVHWERFHLPADKYMVEDYELIILSFDMIDELFHEIKMPGVANLACCATRIVTFHGMIHLICRLDNVIDDSERCSVWAMKEYGVTESWTKVFNINLLIARRGLHNTGLCPEHFRLWGNNEVLMVHDLCEYDEEEVKCKDDLILYNAESRKLKCLFSTTKNVVDLCLYEESLLLMDQRSGIINR